jgi:hypothetical protein
MALYMLALAPNPRPFGIIRLDDHQVAIKDRTWGAEQMHQGRRPRRSHWLIFYANLYASPSVVRLRATPQRITRSGFDRGAHIVGI